MNMKSCTVAICLFSLYFDATGSLLIELQEIYIIIHFVNSISLQQIGGLNVTYAQMGQLMLR